MKDDKIQTGLRIPISRYNELKEMANRSGASVNSIILLLIDVGMNVISSGSEVALRALLHNQKCSTEQHTQRDC